MKKLVVLLVVAVLLLTMSAPVFAFGLPGKHGVDGRDFGGVVSATVRGENPNMSLTGFIGHVGGRLPF